MQIEIGKAKKISPEEIWQAADWLAMHGAFFVLVIYRDFLPAAWNFSNGKHWNYCSAQYFPLNSRFLWKLPPTTLIINFHLLQILPQLFATNRCSSKYRRILLNHSAVGLVLICHLAKILAQESVLKLPFKRWHLWGGFWNSGQATSQCCRLPPRLDTPHLNSGTDHVEGLTTYSGI